MHEKRQEPSATNTSAVDPIIDQTTSSKLNMKLQGMLSTAANSAGQKEFTEKPHQKEYTEKPHQ
jgi:hypothetical protein